MSQLKEEEDVEPACVHIISDSDESNHVENGFAGFPSVQKRYPLDGEQIKEPPSARKKLKIDGDAAEEAAIDLDSISTNPRRTRTKVSSDTSSKFPVSSPSDTMPVAGQRKKYVKNTLPAGAFERMLNEVAQSHPLMTYQEKMLKWKCRTDLSDVEDVNNFDDEFQKRELLYKKNTSGRRSANTGKESPSPYPNYNYQHFRTVILESLKGSPIACTPPPDIQKNQSINVDQPSCSKEADVAVVSVDSTPASKPEPATVIQYEKVLCPSSESSVTKASPSIRLHWTDEESVFRINRLNPEIDKFSKLIKMRIDYTKQINLKAKINEIFKTPTVPPKYTCGFESSEQRRSLEAISEGKSTEERSTGVSPKIVGRRIGTRRSTGGNSARRSSDKLPEVTSFQQDEFCNYLGLGLNGKVYSPTPPDSKRRSLRVKRQQQQVETAVKKQKEKESKEKDATERGKTKEEKNEEQKLKEKEQEVTTTVNETRNPYSSPLTIKILGRSTPEAPNVLRPQPTIIHTPMESVNKTAEIKILLQIRNSPTTTASPTTAGNTPSTATTVNSAVPPPIRRIRRTRATSNGTSTCPRSSQSDESPSKATPRRRRLQYHVRRNNHASDLSESLLSDPQAQDGDGSPAHNGRASTVPSSEGRKEENCSDVPPPEGAATAAEENLHKKFQRYLEESRKTKPSIFILDAIDNSGSKEQQVVEAVTIDTTNNPTVQPPKEKPSPKAKQWPKKMKVHRRLLRRNGVLGGTTNQRILRNRTVMKPLRIKISKHPMRRKMRPVKKDAIQAKLAKQNPIEALEPEKVDESAEVNWEKEPESEEVVTEPHVVEAEDRKQEVDCEEDQEEEPEPMQTDMEMETFDDILCNMSRVGIPCRSVVEKPILEDIEMQTDAYKSPLPISFLTSPSSRMQNPLASENGRVVYAYYELDILTVVQDLSVTFWKTSKLIQVLSKSTCEWMYLGECKRLLFDEEITAPYKNRICVHNSIPIYVEMRAKELSKIRRDCNLISVYINVYYYHDEDLVAKSHSIQLDTVASLPQNVTYTTITDSRYFVMCWSQETVLGKPRSGLCKYSLTPHLDTLASIREFKSMRHEIHYLECTTDDNLIGFGDTQVTLWDHRSGDILMNYDLDFKLGNNFGSIYYPCLEVGDNTVLIFQQTSTQELSIIAINISHNAPSHRFVCTHPLPAGFEHLQSSMRTEDYVILTNTEQQELWIDCADPQYMMRINTTPGQSRFYARCKQNVIDITDEHLALETFSNFVLKMINATEK